MIDLEAAFEERFSQILKSAEFRRRRRRRRRVTPSVLEVLRARLFSTTISRNLKRWWVPVEVSRRTSLHAGHGWEQTRGGAVGGASVGKLRLQFNQRWIIKSCMTAAWSDEPPNPQRHIYFYLTSDSYSMSLQSHDVSNISHKKVEPSSLSPFSSY